MTDFGALAGLAREVVMSARAPDPQQWLAFWPAPDAARASAPASLPVLRWLPAAAAAAPAGPLATLAHGIAAAAAGLAWRQTYRAGEAAPQFLERYGWCELIGLTGPLPSERLACGFLMLGPATVYPRHRHAALELYVPLSGEAEWQRGDAAFATHAPGAAIVHAADEPHSMRTGAAPLLALYLWRGAGLGDPAQLDS